VTVEPTDGLRFGYPNHYPSGCPPDPYTELPGSYYRMIRGPDKAEAADFQSYFERNWRPQDERTQPCQRRAVSIFSKEADAVATLKQFPNLPFRYILKLRLSGSHGIVHRSSANGGSHHDWWIPLGVEPLRMGEEVSGPF
jgi:hypothetical protein